MRRLPLAALGLCLTCAAASALETAQERAFWIEAFQTARTYAADMTAIAYCARKDEEFAARLPIGVVSDLNAIVERARTGAYQARRAAEIVREVLSGVRFASPDASDAELDKACVDRHVLEEYAKLGPIGRPLSMRPPFAER